MLPVLHASFDFIVVGAGSAGCVVARRLAESNKKWRVLLIESGGSQHDPLVQVPSGFSLLVGSRKDWGNVTEADSGTHGRTHSWPRGHMLGGCSSMNAQLYVRGCPANFDRWQRHFRCTGWSYRDCLPFFKRSEDFRGQTAGGDAHGKGGELCVSDPAYLNPWSVRFVKACQQAGLPFNEDMNDGQQAGVGYAQHNCKDGQRHDTATAFLPANGVTVWSNCLVTRLVFQGRRCVGLLYRAQYGAPGMRSESKTPSTSRTGAVSFVGCSREVIVSAGAVNTPALLQRSGLGDPKLLRRIGIPLVASLRGVGRNLQDHLMVPMMYKALKMRSRTLNDAQGSVWTQLRLGLRYALTKRGPVASPGMEALVFSQEDEADLQLHFAAIVPHQWQRDRGRQWGWMRDVSPHYGVTFLPSLLQPRSRGRIEIDSADPRVHPRIFPGYLSDSEGRDVQVLCDGMQLVRRIAKQPAFAECLGEEVVDPELERIYGPAGSPRYDEEYVRRACLSIYHPVGTCRMGPRGDSGAVCDPQLRVHSVRGLRVADCSVMPTIVSANTHAAAVMIGERCADFVEHDWRVRRSRL